MTSLLRLQNSPLAVFIAGYLMFGSPGCLYAHQTGENVIDAHADDIEQINDAVLISNISVAGNAVECVAAELRMGRRPAVDAFDGRTGRPMKPEDPDKPPLGWQAEQTIVVHVSDYMNEIGHNLEEF